MRYEKDHGLRPLQEGLDRNQAEGCCQGAYAIPEQEFCTEMPREQGEEILFADRPRRQMRFTVDFQDAFKP